MCEYPGRSCRRIQVDIVGKMHSNNERQEVSRGHSTKGGILGRAEQSLVPSGLQKEVNMKNAEYQEDLSCPQRDSEEHEGYAGAQSIGG